jgi:DNA-binding response OmpR family regulator
MLVVEDDPDDVNLLRRAMRKAALDLSYDVAGDGEAAIAWLGEAAATGNVPRLVLLDLKLPRKSGFDVLTWMRAHPRLRRVPVVIFTSSAISRDVMRAYDLGANSYLVKPAVPAGLAQMIAGIDGYWLQMNTTE